MEYLLTVAGGCLLGQTLIVLRYYWTARRETRGHVLVISLSYLLLVALAAQPALHLPLSDAAHLLLALIAYALGGWALWMLVPPNGDHGDRPDDKEPPEGPGRRP